MQVTLSPTILCLLGCLGYSNGDMTSTPLSTNGVLTICPDVPLSITCSHNNAASGSTRWRITGTTTQNCNDLLSHDPPDNEVCGPFMITSTSIMDSVLSSTAELVAVPETLDGAIVECLDGAGSVAESLGIITIQVVDSTPSSDFVLYSVESNVTGSLKINVTSPGAYGTDVTYSGSLVGGGGSVQVMNGNLLTVAGLDYSISHTVSITGASVTCSGAERSRQFNYTFKTAKLAISELALSIECSDSLLPVTLTWTVEEGTLSSTDPAVFPLNPPMNRTPNICFSPVGGQVDTAISNSPYILSIPRKNDIYNFTVSVRNVAGETLQDASDFRVSAFSVDTSTIASRSCLTFTVREDCANDISLGNFAILLSYGVGPCQSVTDFPNPTSMTAAITSAAGVCIPVETVSIVELCYTATLMYQNTAVMSQTNLDFQRCVVSTLQAQLGSGVTFTFNRAPDSSETVPHTTIATLECSSVVMTFSGDSQALCVDSEWRAENNSCSIAVWFIVVIIIVALVAIVIVTIVVLVLYLKLKNKEGSSRPVNVEIDGLTKTPPPPDSIYADPNSIDIEDPDEIKSVPHTQDNIAYGHFQQRSYPLNELRGPTYEEPEDIKPGILTQGNLAYGHLQFT